jgi:hypothetical protein
MMVRPTRSWAVTDFDIVRVLRERNLLKKKSLAGQIIGSDRLASCEADQGLPTRQACRRLLAGSSYRDRSHRHCRAIERKGRSKTPMPPKAAAFGRYRRDFQSENPAAPRRYVAAEFLGRASSWLWTSRAAVQRLAF